jgi:hypothetical protein
VASVNHYFLTATVNTLLALRNLICPKFASFEEAATLHVPDLSAVTLVPDTLQIEVVLEIRDTGRPELVTARNVKDFPTFNVLGTPFATMFCGNPVRSVNTSVLNGREPSFA